MNICHVLSAPEGYYWGTNRGIFTILSVGVENEQPSSRSCRQGT
jgi:hypothetical protein